MDLQQAILDLERQLAEALRRLKAREATIESQAGQLERAVDKAREIETMVNKLSEELAR